MLEEILHAWWYVVDAAVASPGLHLFVRMLHHPNVVIWCDMSLSNYAKRKQTGDLVTPSPFGLPVPEGRAAAEFGRNDPVIWLDGDEIWGEYFRLRPLTIHLMMNDGDPEQ